MRYFIVLIFFTIASCSHAVDKPKNLLTEQQMSEIIADFALADQMNFTAAGGDIETETRFILKKHNIKSKDFRESYTYYIGLNKLEDIYNDTQDIILEIDPKGAEYIKQKLKERPVPLETAK